jgi:deoxyribose-phosphate aldolase
MDILNKTWSLSSEELSIRIDKILNESLNRIDKQSAYKKIIGLIDLTTLEGSDNEKKVMELCSQAISFKNEEKKIPAVAAVCVYPPFVKQAKKLLKNTSLQVASVAGTFPSGQSPIEIKLAEIKYAIDEGADEIDMVISRGKFLEGDFQTVFNEIKAIKDICGQIHLKVILETGELGSLENIRKASDIAIYAGGDFIKTSTGKIQPAATEEAFVVMMDAIKDYYNKTGKRIGIKPAGGISEPEVALRYYILIKDILGKEWLTPELFRFGASRLATKLLKEINDA